MCTEDADHENCCQVLQIVVVVVVVVVVEIVVVSDTKI